jgi:hypothetical protein
MLLLVKLTVTVTLILTMFMVLMVKDELVVHMILSSICVMVPLIVLITILEKPVRRVLESSL